jgi:hypothetical protein
MIGGSLACLDEARLKGERSLAEGEGFEGLGVLILKNLACFAYARTARSGEMPGSRNETGTVNGTDFYKTHSRRRNLRLGTATSKLSTSSWLTTKYASRS